jgi:cyclic dehypoxanthinyl futalosine synthase
MSYNTASIISRALALEFLTPGEGIHLYQTLTLPELMAIADAIRYKLHPARTVTWLIDRNVNITNVCVSACKFCNYYRGPRHKDAYITTIDEYKQKIDEMWKLGGRQLLLQGGLHPELGLAYYTKLFRELKQLYPELKLHALGPAEVHHIAMLDSVSYEEVLKQLSAAGLDSLPGAGAEILVDRVRQEVSKNKCTAGQWLDVMRAAHNMNISTSATMMFGHLETLEERFAHFEVIRQVQSEKPAGSIGFISFIPWPFQDEGTFLNRHDGITNQVSGEEYIRTLAMARIMLPNIPNIQASWLTVGKPVAQLCLHAGANDFGSIMIEENVVSVAGANYKFDADGIQRAIREAGFVPVQRNQRFEEVTI